jgi:hypothetical protein
MHRIAVRRLQLAGALLVLATLQTLAVVPWEVPLV